MNWEANRSTDGKFWTQTVVWSLHGDVSTNFGLRTHTGEVFLNHIGLSKVELLCWNIVGAHNWSSGGVNRWASSSKLMFGTLRVNTVIVIVGRDNMVHSALVRSSLSYNSWHFLLVSFKRCSHDSGGSGIVWIRCSCCNWSSSCSYSLRNNWVGKSGVSKGEGWHIFSILKLINLFLIISF